MAKEMHKIRVICDNKDREKVKWNNAKQDLNNMFTSQRISRWEYQERLQSLNIQKSKDCYKLKYTIYKKWREYNHEYDFKHQWYFGFLNISAKNDFIVVFQHLKEIHINFPFVDCVRLVHTSI